MLCNDYYYSLIARVRKAIQYKHIITKKQLVKLNSQSGHTIERSSDDTAVKITQILSTRMKHVSDQ